MLINQNGSFYASFPKTFPLNVQTSWYGHCLLNQGLLQKNYLIKNRIHHLDIFWAKSTQDAFDKLEMLKPHRRKI